MKARIIKYGGKVVKYMIVEDGEIKDEYVYNPERKGAKYLKELFDRRNKIMKEDVDIHVMVEGDEVRIIEGNMKISDMEEMARMIKAVV